MQYKWLNNKNNKKLIVFFNGWGMDEKVVEHLEFKDYDVLTFYDYRNFEINNFDFTKYEQKYLIAWSMGVYVCNYFYEIFKNFDKYIAINGTQKPIDDEFGIPKAIYDLTIENFNELSCSKFIKKISTKLDPCSRATKELKEELIAIKYLKIKDFFKFNKSIISNKDRIIPSQNQKNFWKTFEEIDAPHYIFDLYKSWDELL